MYLSKNGIILSDDCIPIHEKSFQYGYGLFETLKIYKGKIYFLMEHLERLKKGCHHLNLSLEYDLKKIEAYCYDLLKKCPIDFGAMKIMCTHGVDKSHLYITINKRSYTLEDYKKGFSITFADSKKNPYSPLVYIKSNNYLENLLIRQIALKKGYDEAIYLNVHDHLCEGSFTNLFFIKDSTLYTPSTDCGLLEGIMRKHIIHLIHDLNLSLEIGHFTKDQLIHADEIFLTNSLMDIMHVSRINGRNFHEVGKITTLLQQKFYQTFYY